ESRRGARGERCSAGVLRQEGSRGEPCPGGEGRSTVADGDLLREAVGELYSSAPAEFVERRGALVARARAAGEASAAKNIAALRKPTRSAWVINRLTRSDPGVPARLIELGDELRAAHGSLDGAAIRGPSARPRPLLAA